VRVVVHPADEGGSGFYRLIAPARALAAQGHDVALEYDFTYSAVWQPSAFGPDRMIYGGGFEANATAESYVAARERLLGYVSHFSPADQDKVAGGTAAKLFKFA